MALSGAGIKAVAGAVCVKVVMGGGGGGTMAAPAESTWRHLGHISNDAKISIPSTKTELWAQPSLGKIKSETVEDSFDFTAKLLEGSNANPTFMALALGRNPATYDITAAGGLPLTPGEGNLIVEVKIVMYYDKFTSLTSVTNCLAIHIGRAAVITDSFELLMSAIHEKKWSEIPIKFEGLCDPVTNGIPARMRMGVTANIDVAAGGVLTARSGGFFDGLFPSPMTVA